MPSSNRRRMNSSRRTIQTRQRSRSLSTIPVNIDNDQTFIIILTNHPDILRNHTIFRIHIDNQNEENNDIRNSNAQMNHYTDLNDREDMLINLLRIDLNEVVQEYLLRTRRPLPIHLILEASN